MIEKASDHIRIFYNVFTIEEKLFTIMALSNSNCIDDYLCSVLLNNHTNDMLSHFDNSYHINYFKDSVRLDLCIVNMLSKHVQYNKSIKQNHIDNKLLNFTKVVLDKIEKKFRNDALSFVELASIYKDIIKLSDVFGLGECRNIEKMINDIVLDKYKLFNEGVTKFSNNSKKKTLILRILFK
jgi:hypothetical protein